MQGMQGREHVKLETVQAMCCSIRLLLIEIDDEYIILVLLYHGSRRTKMEFIGIGWKEVQYVVHLDSERR
jgi:hypothetical protein